MTALTAVIAVLACAYTPFYFHDTYIISALLFILMQLGISIAIVLFFFGGITKIEKTKVVLALISCTLALASLANATNQTYILIGDSTIIMDVISLFTVNICATLVTLTFTRIRKRSVEREKESAKKSLTQIENLAKATKPLALASLIFASFALVGINPPSFVADRSFSVTAPFFFLVQLGTTYILTNNCFSEAKGNQKSRIYFSVLSLALLLGFICNFQHDQVTLRVGNRIDINTITFLVMNLGGLITVISFHSWKSYVQSLKERLDVAKTIEAPSKT